MDSLHSENATPSLLRPAVFNTIFDLFLNIVINSIVKFLGERACTGRGYFYSSF
jgi:hypothetical protein